MWRDDEQVGYFVGRGFSDGAFPRFSVPVGLHASASRFQVRSELIAESVAIR